MNLDGLISGLSALIGVLISSFIAHRYTKSTTSKIVVGALSGGVITVIIFVSLMLIFHRF
ncbi:hypothetical protein EIG99_00155 [Staphylococcus condimenti]|uniref:Uncharacterized protein n=1 Tax=Staphylococcus condimenti TaxID=70255 RepID=A0A4Q7CX07_9STAP|nr:hypothetical protein [Staphylococcus condimenti]RZI04958.1 hypothetical protein EIG99_00155 [Staphylococcus condimenti]RZI05809.1 hypothetical protein EIG98_00130 [Staphylococcus condimenti]